MGFLSIPVEAFGCVRCHGGERLALDATLAHSTMRGGRNPSDLAVVRNRTVDLAPDGFVCRCHASRFGPQGALLQGPATRPLHALLVEIGGNGHVVLHTDREAK